MAAGDRNKTGKPVDIVRHYAKEGVAAVCGRKNVGYLTDDITDTTCVSCLKKVDQKLIKQ